MRILIVDDQKEICSMLKEYIDEKYEFRCDMAFSYKGAVELMNNNSYFLVISDINMPGKSGLELLDYIKNDKQITDCDVILMTGLPDVKSSIQALKQGAYDYIVKPVDLDEISAAIDKTAEHQALLRENKKLTADFDSELEKFRKRLANMEVGSGDIDNYQIFSDESAGIQKTALELSHSRQISTIIEGETGTGKELIARLIHNGIDGNSNPFVALNCAAIPETLFEAELFGYEKGTFTGGLDSGKIGKLELAQKGTIFLDEIAEMPLQIQAKLLRVLEEKSFYRLGGLKKIKTDVRIIAATNKDLGELAKNRSFREDLFYRIAVARIHLKPLRERRDEILRFTDYFLRKFLRTQDKIIMSDNARNELLGYNWPGNVRELRNVVERVSFFTRDNYIETFGLSFKSASKTVETVCISEFTLPDKAFSIKDLEREIIRKALAKHNNNKTRTAAYLKLSRSALRSKIRTHGLE